MLGTTPTFYKIPVAKELVYNDRHGTYPPQSTHVSVCYPPVPRPNRRRSEGMKPLDNRREILRCYEAFSMRLLKCCRDLNYLFVTLGYIFPNLRSPPTIARCTLSTVSPCRTRSYQVRRWSPEAASRDSLSQQAARTRGRRFGDPGARSEDDYARVFEQLCLMSQSVLKQ